MSEQTFVDRLRWWLGGILIALGQRLGGVYEECGVLTPDGGFYCALPVDHPGPHADV